jgi:hypothetical protein
MIQEYSPKIIGFCCRWRSSAGTNPHEPGEPDAVRHRHLRAQQCALECACKTARFSPWLTLTSFPGNIEGVSQALHLNSLKVRLPKHKGVG